MYLHQKSSQETTGNGEVPGLGLELSHLTRAQFAPDRLLCHLQPSNIWRLSQQHDPEECSLICAMKEDGHRKGHKVLDIKTVHLSHAPTVSFLQAVMLTHKVRVEALVYGIAPAVIVNEVWRITTAKPSKYALFTVVAEQRLRHLIKSTEAMRYCLWFVIVALNQNLFGFIINAASVRRAVLIGVGPA